jgi:hypothetical protein
MRAKSKNGFAFGTMSADADMSLVQTAIAPAIALLAVVIGGMQWWSTRQRFVLDLFEKRFAVYQDARKIASEALQSNAILSKGLSNEVFTRGRFLFGPEMTIAFTRLHNLAGEVEVGRPGAAMELMNLFDQMQPMFMPYLNMPQKMPSLARIWRRWRR